MKHTTMAMGFCWALALGCTACGSPQSTAPTAPQAQPEDAGGSNGSRTAPAPRRIDSFADSLAEFRFAFDPSNRKATVSFTRYAPEGWGGLSLEAERDYDGELPQGGGSSPLVARGDSGSEYTVSVDCADNACRQATIEINKLSGKLAGRAVLKRELRNVSGFLNQKMPAGRLTTSHDPLTAALAELGNRDNLSSVATAAVSKLDGSDRAFFEVEYDFLPQPIMRSEQPGYFDDKVLLLTGEIGNGMPVRATRQLRVRGRATTITAAATGKAKFRESPFSVAVTFERSDLRNPTAVVSEAMTGPFNW